MKKKYYLRGLGLGILVTALVFILTNAGGMTDEEIIKRAEELGYVKQTTTVVTPLPNIDLEELKNKENEITPKPTKKPEPTEAPTSVPEPSDTPVPTETPLPTPTAEPTEVPVPTETPVPAPTSTPVPTAAPTQTPVPTSAPEQNVVLATIVVERGASANMICRQMEEKGIIASQDDFRNYLVRNNLADFINIGSYHMSSDMSYRELARILTGR